MKIVDTNVLLYAVNESAEHHREAVAWLDGVLSGRSTVGFSWIRVLAFVRLSTKVGLFPAPLTVDQAVARVRAWLAQPTSVLLEPTAQHLDVLCSLLRHLGGGGTSSTMHTSLRWRLSTGSRWSATTATSAGSPVSPGPHPEILTFLIRNRAELSGPHVTRSPE